MGRKPPRKVIGDPPAAGLGGSGDAALAAPPQEPIGPNGPSPLVPSESTGGAPEPESALRELESQLASARAQIADLNERWLRSAADLENYRRRAERERSEARRYAEASILGQLLPVLDNLERAFEVDPNAPPEAFREGVELIGKLLSDILSRLGVTPIAVLGQAFDPEIHEAVARRPDESPAGTVIAEHEKGYCLGDRLLRPAKVIVSQGLELGGRAASAASEPESGSDAPEAE